MAPRGELNLKELSYQVGGDLRGSNMNLSVERGEKGVEPDLKSDGK